ncbi:MAG: hypothetical protein IKS48_08950 [Eubacterium sp.]|nr:hypothetical protein [Eubacterium sp.]
MAATPEYIEDYLRIIKQELKDKYKFTEDEAARAVYKSAVRSILCGDNEDMRRIQMHKSLAETTLDVYRQYKNIGVHGSARNGEADVNKINTIDSIEPMREKHKERSSVLQEIPLKPADEK